MKLDFELNRNQALSFSFLACRSLTSLIYPLRLSEKIAKGF